MTIRALTAPRSKPYSARQAEKSPIIEQLANSRPVDVRVCYMHPNTAKPAPRLAPYLVPPSKKGGNWQYRYNGKLRTTGKKDRGEANLFLARFMQELESPAVRTGASATLADIIDAWERERESANPTTWKRKWQYVARRLRQHGGWKTLPEIDTDWMLDYADDRYDQGISEPTVRQDLTSLLSAWKLARQSKITSLPVPTVKLPRASEPAPFFLTHDEAERLIQAADRDHVRLFVRLGLATAGRHAALLQLTWSRVDLETGYVDLRLRDPVESARARKSRQRKEGRKAREVRMAAEPAMKGRGFVRVEGAVLVALREARERSVTNHVVEWAGAPIMSIATGFRSAVIAAGLDPQEITPHALRHTAITWLMQAGEDINQIASFAGHSSPEMIKRVYGHHHPAFQASISRTLAQRA